MSRSGIVPEYILRNNSNIVIKKEMMQMPEEDEKPSIEKAVSVFKNKKEYPDKSLRKKKALRIFNQYLQEKYDIPPEY